MCKLSTILLLLSLPLSGRYLSLSAPGMNPTDSVITSDGLPDFREVCDPAQTIALLEQPFKDSSPGGWHFDINN
jgi:hypothetical protein